ncbi:hypothetical protein EJB05_51440, partial [Eragrostis curvula]
MAPQSISSPGVDENGTSERRGRLRRECGVVDVVDRERRSVGKDIRGKMSLGKVATGLLIIYATLLPHLVSGTDPAACTMKQRNQILINCYRYIRRHPEAIPSVDNNSSCCESVRQVPNRDMHCVVDDLTKANKEEYRPLRILSLQKLCAPAPPPVNEVKEN